MQARNFENREVITIKFISAEEVIAKVDAESTDFPNALFVTHPHVISTNGEAFGLMPYIITADEDELVEINVNAIAGLTKPLAGIATAYLEKTTGLTLVKA